MTTPSTGTGLPEVVTRTVRLPVRTRANDATGSTRVCRTLALRSDTRPSQARPSRTETDPHRGHVVATSATRRPRTPVSVNRAPARVVTAWLRW